MPAVLVHRRTERISQKNCQEQPTSGLCQEFSCRALAAGPLGSGILDSSPLFVAGVASRFLEPKPFRSPSFRLPTAARRHPRTQGSLSTPLAADKKVSRRGSTRPLP